MPAAGQASLLSLSAPWPLSMAGSDARDTHSHGQVEDNRGRKSRRGGSQQGKR